jgi:fructose-bisphosphate aldolase/6-deoxy-5-ketofructose 1-phosphate synthase
MLNLKILTPNQVIVPGDVPKAVKDVYIENYLKITKSTGRVLVFVGDHKILYLNDAFYGPNISKEDADPEHMFKIASKANLGCFVSQPGLISRYAQKYPDVPYLVKMNAKTKMSPKLEKEQVGGVLGAIEQIVAMRKTGINVLGIGFNLYIGGKYEHIMMKQAAEFAYQAHRHGLIAMLWSVLIPKGGIDVNNPHNVAGAAGVAAALGYDFVNLRFAPKTPEELDKFEEVVLAAGNCKVYCRGGEFVDAKVFLERVWDQINIAKVGGCGVGRNIHQRSEDEAVRLCNALACVTYGGDDVKIAEKTYETGELSDNLKRVLKEGALKPIENF